jgi:hypothetical protein
LNLLLARYPFRSLDTASISGGMQITLPEYKLCQMSNG